MRATLARGAGEATARRGRRYQDHIRLTDLRRYAVAATFLLAAAFEREFPINACDLQRYCRNPSTPTR
jgi:hypothetical protein